MIFSALDLNDTFQSSKLLTGEDYLKNSTLFSFNIVLFVHLFKNRFHLGLIL